MTLNRRRFIKCVALASGGSITRLCEQSASATEPGHQNDTLGVLVDISNCIGCRKCEYACQEAAGFPVPPFESFEDNSVFAEHRRPHTKSYTTVNAFQVAEAPAKPVYVKANCLHCLQPACASACLVGALTRQCNGAVIYDAAKCMGCRYCMVACPFQIPAYDYDDPFTPQVRKCTFCFDRISQNGGVPACVKICPNDALTYGKRGELLTIAHERIAAHPEKYIDHVY